MKFKGLHLEPTNKCTLKCSKCARTTFLEKFGHSKWTNYELDLEELKRFVDVDLAGLRVTMSGNYGDPIYHKDLLGIVKWCKQQKASVEIVTNGSYKTPDWWTKLGYLLDEQDQICFSIDGLPHNFIRYRVNADWPSILQGIKIINETQVKTVWKYIPFSYNQNDINAAKQLSDELGFDSFSLLHSNRWDGDDDWLKPTEDLVGPKHQIQVNFVKNKDDIDINPKCYEGQWHFISADGYYMPCCFMGDWRFYYKTAFYKNKEQYKISNTTLSQILKQEDQFFENIPQTKLPVCTFNCPKI